MDDDQIRSDPFLLPITWRGSFELLPPFASTHESRDKISPPHRPSSTHLPLTTSLSFRLPAPRQKACIMSDFDFQTESPDFPVDEPILHNGRNPLDKIEAASASKVRILEPVVVLQEELPPYDQASEVLPEVSSDTHGLDPPPPYSSTPMLQAESIGLHGTAASPNSLRPRRNPVTSSATKNSRSSKSRPSGPSSTSSTSAAPARGENMALIAATLAFANHPPGKPKECTAKLPQAGSQQPQPTAIPPKSQTNHLTNLDHPFAPVTPQLPLHLDHTYRCPGVQLPGAWPLD